MGLSEYTEYQLRAELRLRENKQLVENTEKAKNWMLKKIGFPNRIWKVMVKRQEEGYEVAGIIKGHVLDIASRLWEPGVVDVRFQPFVPEDPEELGGVGKVSVPISINYPIDSTEIGDDVIPSAFARWFQSGECRDILEYETSQNHYDFGTIVEIKKVKKTMTAEEVEEAGRRTDRILDRRF